MDAFTAKDFTHKSGEITHYYEGGCRDGTPLVFIHGWPDIAETWIHQLSHFSTNSTYRIIAPDMRGYGGSTSPKHKSAYSLETLSNELVELASGLNIEKAVWIGHDWGAAILSALASHHPSLFLGLVLLCVPYRTYELGLSHLDTLINREIYSLEQYPYGQFEYMHFYEQHYPDTIKTYETHIERITKSLYTPHDPASFGKPSARTSGGQFRHGPAGYEAFVANIPDLPLSSTFISSTHYNNLLTSHKNHGFFPPTAYYLNNEANADFATQELNGGVLEFPVLYFDAKFDPVSSLSIAPEMGMGQMRKTRDLRVRIVEAGHWPQLEKWEEVNGVLEGWLGEKIL